MGGMGPAGSGMLSRGLAAGLLDWEVSAEATDLALVLRCLNKDAP